MPNKLALPEQAAGFIETMDCLPVSKLPDGPEWTYEIKLDGYRLEVVRKSRTTTLYSRRENVLNQKFPYIATALQHLPSETVIDGEVVALGADGKPWKTRKTRENQDWEDVKKSISLKFRLNRNVCRRPSGRL
jgi:ATP-dependent DNA ligase